MTNPPAGERPDYPEYQPPSGESTPRAYGSGGGVPARAGTFDAGEAVAYGWRGFTKNLGPLVLLALIVILVTIVLQLISGRIDNTAARTLFNIVSNLISLILAAGVLRAALAIVDGRKPRVEMLFEGKGTITYVLASIVTSIAFTIGLILLIIPGLILIFLFQFFGYAAVDDENVGVFGSIARSVKLVTSNIGPVILLDLIAIGLAILSVITLGLGFLVTVPLIYIASAYAYRRMNGGRVVEPA